MGTLDGLIGQCRICERDFAVKRAGEDLCSDKCRERASYERRLQARYMEIADRLMIARSAQFPPAEIAHLAGHAIEVEAAVKLATPTWLEWFKHGE